MSYHVRVFDVPWTDDLYLGLFITEGGTRCILTPTGDIKEINGVEAVSPHDNIYFKLPRHPEWAQMIVDALYEYGIRPKAYVPSKGEMETQTKHLNDMRAIVAKCFSVPSLLKTGEKK